MRCNAPTKWPRHCYKNNKRTHRMNTDFTGISYGISITPTSQTWYWIPIIMEDSNIIIMYILVDCTFPTSRTTNEVSIYQAQYITMWSLMNQYVTRYLQKKSEQRVELFSIRVSRVFKQTLSTLPLITRQNSYYYFLKLHNILKGISRISIPCVFVLLIWINFLWWF